MRKYEVCLFKTKEKEKKMKKTTLLLVGALFALGACSSNSDEGKKCTCMKMQCDHGGSAGIVIKEKPAHGAAGITIKNTNKETGAAGVKITSKKNSKKK